MCPVASLSLNTGRSVELLGSGGGLGQPSATSEPGEKGLLRSRQVLRASTSSPATASSGVFPPQAQEEKAVPPVSTPHLPGVPRVPRVGEGP